MPKKSFEFTNENPALQHPLMEYLSDNRSTSEARGNDKNEAEKKELRTRRVQLVLTQSLYEKAKQKRRELDISMNEYIAQLIENDINKGE